MKKILITLAAIALSISVANAAPEKACIDINQSIASNMTESRILDNLVSASCGMGLHDSVNAIVAAGGNLDSALTAALSIDPTFTYTDPTTGLLATAAGSSNSRPISFSGGSGGSGGGGGVTTSP